MKRGLLLLLATVGLAPALLLAIFNLGGGAWSVFSPRQGLWFSGQLYFPDGTVRDFGPVLNLSIGTSLLLLVGVLLLLFALWRFWPRTLLKPDQNQSDQPH